MNEEGETAKQTAQPTENGAVLAEGAVAEPEGPAYDIERRTLAFGVRAVTLFRALQAQPDRSGWIVGRQFLRSATLVGANVAEARAGESSRDFLHKLQIAQREARESLYWLRLMTDAAMLPPERLAPLTQEADEILRILVAIARNAKLNARS